MARTGRGLSDNARTGIGIAFSALLAINASAAGLAASNQVDVPTWVYFMLGMAAVVIYAIKDQLGIRDATSSAVSKSTDPNYPQHRNVNPTA